MAFTHQVIFTVNGPGEISGWLFPLATAIKREYPHVKVCVALLPCVFSSGSELHVVRNLPYVDAACSVSETFSMMFFNRYPEGFSTDLPGFVMHLGGETWVAWIIAKRLKQPSIAYVETPFPLQSKFTKVFYSGFEKISNRKIASGSEVAGELMIDATRMRCPDRNTRPRDKFVIGIYPGSRDYIVKYILPFISVAADQVYRVAPQIDFVMAKAEFLPLDFLKNIPDVNDGRPIEGQNLTFEPDSEAGGFLLCESGLRIEIVTNRAAMGSISMAVTIPGTNTAELGVLGIPFILILPTVWAETSPLPGIGGHVDKIPIIGRYIKRALALLFLRRFKFLSHPNRRADRLIVPELVSALTARELSDEILKMQASDLEPLSEELRQAMGSAGATEKILAFLSPFLQNPTISGASNMRQPEAT